MLAQSEVKENMIAGVKVTVSWLLSIQAQEIAIWLSIIYTGTLLYVLVRDKIIRKARQRKIAAELKKETDYDESTR
jgi:predicted membrane protein